MLRSSFPNFKKSIFCFLATISFISPKILCAEAPKPHFTDPDGNLKLIIDPKVLEELTIFADFPIDCDWFDFGHGWSALKNKNGICICRGHYVEGPQDDSMRATEDTISIAFQITPVQASRVMEIFRDPGEYHLLRNNCIDMVTKILDVCDIKHPDFKDFARISHPTKLYRWINEQNKGAQKSTNSTMGTWDLRGEFEVKISKTKDGKYVLSILQA
jgi:hypothetical protein